MGISCPKILNRRWQHRKKYEFDYANFISFSSPLRVFLALYVHAFWICSDLRALEVKVNKSTKKLRENINTNLESSPGIEQYKDTENHKNITTKDRRTQLLAR